MNKFDFPLNDLCKCETTDKKKYTDSLIININKFQNQAMFQNTYQSGFLSILYSIGSKPLQIWDKSSTFMHN